jgi:hypothetical protein
MAKPDFNLPISSLELSVAASTALGEQRDKNGHMVAPAIRTLGELLTLRERDLLVRPGFGRRHLREIKELLAGTWGIGLGMKFQDYSDDYKLCESDVIAQLTALVEAGAKPSTMLLAIQCGDHRGKSATSQGSRT